MYGPTPMSATDTLDNPPPVNRFKRFNAWLAPKKLSSCCTFTPGSGITANKRVKDKINKTTRTRFLKSGKENIFIKNF